MTAALRDADHENRVVHALRNAVRNVPFYVKAGYVPPPPNATLAEALAAAPLLTRDRIRPTLPRMWLPESRDAKTELASGKIAVVETGTDASRVRVVFDRAWWAAQERRALRVSPAAASALAGDHGPYKDAVLWVPERGTGSCGAGDPPYEERLEGARLHLNSRQDPTFWSEAVMTRMLDELARHATVGLVADPFYLDVLARHAAAVGRSLDVRGFVAVTRALPTTAHISAVRRVYGGPVVDVYASRDVGTMFVEAEDGLLHHAPITTHVELLPVCRETPGAKDVAAVVVTTLDREVQPLVRYVVGDLVQTTRGQGLYTTVPPIAGVEGRIEDVIVRPDGALITPRALDRALAPLDLRGYQATQTEAAVVELDVVGGSPDDARDALAVLLSGMRVSARAATATAVEPNGKYRSSRRRIPLGESELFELQGTSA